MKKRLEQTGLCEEVVLIKKKKCGIGKQDKRKAQKIKERRMLRARKQHNKIGQGWLATPPSLHAQLYRQDSHKSPAAGLPNKTRALIWSQSIAY